MLDLLKIYYQYPWLCLVIADKCQFSKSRRKKSPPQDTRRKETVLGKTITNKNNDNGILWCTYMGTWRNASASVNTLLKTLLISFVFPFVVLFCFVIKMICFLISPNIILSHSHPAFKLLIWPRDATLCRSPASLWFFFVGWSNKSPKKGALTFLAIALQTSFYYLKMIWFFLFYGQTEGPTNSGGNSRPLGYI